ncbi:hypothetical protein tb265_47590 [Gemmatimonadetes bacterium T265]|nr:hypothetical protein tb265_47590 [Gemmatimonadetes bacterium T265]
MTTPAAPGPSAAGAAPPAAVLAAALAGVFPGDSALAHRCRAADWAATPLGPVAGWPQSLRTTVQGVLASGFAAVVLWGPELAQVYNDAYVPFLGVKDAAALGTPTRAVWPEVWAFNAPIYARVRAGETVTLVEQRYVILRGGPDAPGDALDLTISYAPVRDEAGAVAGVLVTLVDATAQVAARAAAARQAFLAALGDALRPLADPAEIQRAAAHILGAHLGVQRAFYTAVDGDGPDAAYAFVGHYAQDVPPLPPGRYPVAAFGDAVVAPLRAGRAVRVADTEADARFDAAARAAYRGASIRAHAAVPLVKAGRLVALFGVHAAAPRAWTDDELALVAETAERTWAAVERARAEAALRESEARFRAVEDASPDGSVLMRPEYEAATGPIIDFTFVYGNPAAERLLGPLGPGLVGRTLCAAYPDAGTNGYLAGYVRAYEAGVPFVVETEDHGRFGRPVHLTLTAVRAGALVHARFVDVSAAVAAAAERERLLAAERGARAEAEAANAAKSQFLANMSHELRTPLNAIGGYTQLVELGIHGPVTDAQRQALGRVQAAQGHLLGLINDVLNYAKLEGGRVEYHLEAVDVRAVVRAVVPLVAPQLAAKGLTLDVRLPEAERPDGPGAPDIASDAAYLVWADREKLGQVLLNLLSNAVKFTDGPHAAPGAAGRVTVDVATRVGEGAVRGDVVFLRVADTGRGIARAQQAAVFDPFVQVDQRLTRAQQGTGLGLAISRDLARGMGGDLRVRSTPGAGAAFTVTLRRATDPDGRATERRARDERRAHERRTGADRRADAPSP